MSDPTSDSPRTPITWDPITRSRAHEQVLDAIEEQVMAGRLAVGDTLPPERDLAARLQVSRASVREAIRILESQGVLQSQVGSGRSAGTTVTALPSKGLTRLLRMHIGLSSFPLDDVVEARIALERASAKLASEQADDTQQATITEALTALEDAESLEAFNDADTAFHVAIAEAAGNRLVADLTTAIRSSLRLAILDAFRAEDGPEELRTSLQEQHRQIHDAILARDSRRSQDLVEEHIRFAVDALPAMRRDHG
ncbi:FadR/GntR family transcriptional regulator [Nesterenkonia sp. PF2B19]|uniref:FadR/GntR family transcriptional regulator n=1 Tax=Nesterenkonia sp. PF2B19 TaxID=1881858 RepID=UPI000A19E2E0|nr:FadR/GntR family transcriptional regulator [Nesterenkonia sp. PF2B19]OSM43204.1 GntR family transcriptional regulator [Nesterenkonia sp. PF2B19]